MCRVWCGVILGLAAACAGAFTRADDDPAPAAGEAVVTDVDGKEFKLTGVKFTTGTRRLAWLADPKGATDDAKKGPLALEVREPNSSLPLSKGVLTLVPVASLESAKFDYEKQVVSLVVKGLKEPITGTLEYKGINVLGFGGTSGGKTAAFTGGILSKTAVKTATFAGAEALTRPKAAGITWNVQIVQKSADNPTVTARNLKVLYSFPGGAEQLADGIPVRKGEPIPFDEKLKRFEVLANDLTTNVAAAEVEVGTGPERVIIIPPALEQDKKTGTLVGFVGEVDAGWKLFPLHTIKVIKPSMRKIE
jgi:hypothetical protein